MARAPQLVILLADSTAYGLLPGGSCRGSALIHERRQNTHLLASIACGGALMKKGQGKKLTIVEQFMREYALTDGVNAMLPGTKLEVAIVAARDSVPGYQYDSLMAARESFGVPETTRSIREMAPQAYGDKRKMLHFLEQHARQGIFDVVDGAVNELMQHRSHTAMAEHCSALQDTNWVAVVVCAGWNCKNEEEVMAECFLESRLAKCQDWMEFMEARRNNFQIKMKYRCGYVVVLSAHCALKLPWNVTAMRLRLPPATLLQTHFSDHDGAKRNKEIYANGLSRIFVDDEACVRDLRELGGSVLLAKHHSFQRGAHRADLWRYVRLFRDGGNYLDIKMCLLQPLQETLDMIYAEGNAMLNVASQMVAEAGSKTEDGGGKGQRIAQPIESRRLSETQRNRIANVKVAERMLEATLGEDLREQPHLIMSRGANQEHVFQGNILGCSAKHPLMARAISDAISTTQEQLANSYLKFCKFLWKEMEKDLNGTPEIGWNFCPTLGPIYLLEERQFRKESLWLCTVT
eukprot:Skav231974  [mRNA]  locus=scaffold1566:9251:10885:+ [translate_table: standard]